MEELLERGVAALERLASDEVEILAETKPPVCPHCDRVNPNVRVEETTGEGPLVEFCTVAHCLNCNNVFYVIPYQYDCIKTLEEAQEIMTEKVRLGGYQGEDQRAAAGANASGSGGM